MTETIILLISLALAGTGLVLALRSDLPFIRHGTERVTAKIVRHHKIRDDGATFYAAVLLVPTSKGDYIQVRDNLFTPFPKPIIGELVEVVHPADMPSKARIPHPWFRTLMYIMLVYIFVVIGLRLTGWN